jgi:hypothetical protein
VVLTRTRIIIVYLTAIGGTLGSQHGSTSATNQSPKKITTATGIPEIVVAPPGFIQLPLYPLKLSLVNNGLMGVITKRVSPLHPANVNGVPQYPNHLLFREGLPTSDTP